MNIPEHVTITSCGGACPTQAEGTIHGLPFYFRSRHGSWSLQVTNPGLDPLSDDLVYEECGDDPSRGFMEDDQVMAILALHAEPILVAKSKPGRSARGW